MNKSIIVLVMGPLLQIDYAKRNPTDVNDWVDL